MNSYPESYIAGLRGAEGLSQPYRQVLQYLDQPSSIQTPDRATTSASCWYIDHYHDPIWDLEPFNANGEENGSQQLHAQSGQGSPSGKIKESNTVSTEIGDPDWEPTAFPPLLYRMLSNAAIDGTEHIVSWASHGRAFHVHKREAFEAEVMPKYFQTKKYSSFARQLGLYNFNRIKNGSDKGSFYNEFFLKGRPDLMSRIRRQQQGSKKGHKAPRPVPKKEPNLHLYPVCKDLSPAEICQLWDKRHQSRMMKPLFGWSNKDVPPLSVDFPHQSNVMNTCSSNNRISFVDNIQEQGGLQPIRLTGSSRLTPQVYSADGGGPATNVRKPLPTGHLRGTRNESRLSVPIEAGIPTTRDQLRSMSPLHFNTSPTQVPLATLDASFRIRGQPPSVLAQNHTGESQLTEQIPASLQKTTAPSWDTGAQIMPSSAPWTQVQSYQPQLSYNRNSIADTFPDTEEQLEPIRAFQSQKTANATGNHWDNAGHRFEAL